MFNHLRTLPLLYIPLAIFFALVVSAIALEFLLPLPPSLPHQTRYWGYRPIPPVRLRKINRVWSAAALSLFVTLLAGVGCFVNRPEPPRPETQLSRDLKGSHPLRQIESNLSTSGYLTRSYFLFGSGATGTISGEYRVTFAWLGNDGVYRYTTLPLSKVRVVTDPRIQQPIVRFRWIDQSGRYDTPEDMILYVVIGVNPGAWPEKIDMPLGGGKDR